jgi:protoporphyrinogen oxidase
MIIETKYLILGSGISGLSFASFCDVDDFIIVEKESTAGGYCKSIYKDGFVWDYSGHFFHFTDNDIRDYIFENIEGEIVKVKKKTKILYNENYIDFPFQKNIHQLDKKDFIDCLYDFYFAKNLETKDTFKDLIYSKFGKSICDKFLIPYNEKLYSCDMSKLDSKCMGRFFPDTDFESTLLNFKETNNTSYNETFIYPKNGAYQFIESLLKRIDLKKIMFDMNITSIDIEKKEAHFSDGTTIIYEKLVSTVPLNILLNLLGSTDNVELSSNKVLVINMGFDKPIKNDFHWIYFPEKKYNFYRVGFYSNILAQKRGSLYVEIGFGQNDEIDIEREIGITIDNLKKIDIIDEDPVSYHTVVMNPAYCYITRENQEYIKSLFEKLNKHDVYSIGRYGRWTYCSIEDNIKEAKDLIKKIR